MVNSQKRVLEVLNSFLFFVLKDLLTTRLILQILWAQKIDGASFTDIGNDIAVDGDNVYATGYFNGSTGNTTFGGGKDSSGNNI